MVNEFGKLAGSGMSKRRKVIGGFAAVGFVMPWVLLAFYEIAHLFGKHPGTTLLEYLCPPSIASLGLDNATWIVGIIGWIFISAANAVLYLIPGCVVALFFGPWKWDESTSEHDR